MSRTIQDNLHLVCLIIEQVDSKAAVNNLDQSKAFDGVEHQFLEAVLMATSFGPRSNKIDQVSIEIRRCKMEIGTKINRDV